MWIGRTLELSIHGNQGLVHFSHRLGHGLPEHCQLLLQQVFEIREICHGLSEMFFVCLAVMQESLSGLVPIPSIQDRR